MLNLGFFVRKDKVFVEFEGGALNDKYKFPSILLNFLYNFKLLISHLYRSNFKAKIPIKQYKWLIICSIYTFLQA